MGNRHDDDVQTILTTLTGAGRTPFRRADATAAGLSRRRWVGLGRAGVLASPHLGVLTLGEPDDLRSRAGAAGLVLPPGAAIGRRTAAELLGVDPRTPAERGRVLDVECLVPRGRAPIRRPGLQSFATDLPGSEVTTAAGFPVTTADRTAADLLRWLPPFMGLAVVDAMAGRGLVGVGQIAGILDRWDRHRFIDQARRLLSWVDPGAESYGESWLRLRLLEAGFPPPEVQIPIRDDDGRQLYRIDMGYRELKLGLEYDGEEFHHELADGARDSGRRADLDQRFGWNVLGFRKNLVLGPSMQLERGVGELLGMEPANRYRAW